MFTSVFSYKHLKLPNLLRIWHLKSKLEVFIGCQSCHVRRSLVDFQGENDSPSALFRCLFVQSLALCRGKVHWSAARAKWHWFLVSGLFPAADFKTYALIRSAAFVCAALQFAVFDLELYASLHVFQQAFLHWMHADIYTLAHNFRALVLGVSAVAS